MQIDEGDSDKKQKRPLTMYIRRGCVIPHEKWYNSKNEQAYGVIVAEEYLNAEKQYPNKPPLNIC